MRSFQCTSHDLIVNSFDYKKPYPSNYDLGNFSAKHFTLQIFAYNLSTLNFVYGDLIFNFDTCFNFFITDVHILAILK